MSQTFDIVANYQASLEIMKTRQDRIDALVDEVGMLRAQLTALRYPAKDVVQYWRRSPFACVPDNQGWQDCLRNLRDAIIAYDERPAEQS